MLYLYHLMLLTCILMCIPLNTSANEPTSLPLGSILNDKGQPITPSNKTHTDLRFSNPVIKKSSTQKPTNKKTTNQKTKAKSRKQQLASRDSVANNPSCRWLNTRMTSLERNLDSGVNSRNQHYQQELDMRQDEWQCMKCGAEGPEQADHAVCQYRR